MVWGKENRLDSMNVLGTFREKQSTIFVRGSVAMKRVLRCLLFPERDDA